MKTFLFAPLAAALLTATSAFAAPLPAGPSYPPFDHDHDRGGYNLAYRPDYREHDHWDEGHREAPATTGTRPTATGVNSTTIMTATSSMAIIRTKPTAMRETSSTATAKGSIMAITATSG
ncbi:hypothetical protein GKZ68_00290 [Hymenobacter sp. BRD128]|uniref:hypothetical protein n=1 Tax=Hymenobacter sp. BRD128 TaxID=2675878 RepID=UPI001567A945|nr:hypothetical protein [Hymenobacter sp. BRD128]QKG55210.1 hypothetical protein GKZ68_00290 [Hymenobacter sp. BRD128]